jgi:hypothetical protein
MLERGGSRSGFADAGRFAAVSEKTVIECNERKDKARSTYDFLLPPVLPAPKPRVLFF